MTSISAYFPLLLRGTSITIGAWIFCSCLSLVLGIILGILSCQQMDNSGMRALIRCYTFIAKGIPAYVQILIAYFVIPALLGINLPAFIVACGALAFCSSGYVTEIVRGGINSVAVGQWDACTVLGYSKRAAIFRVILPQARAAVLPALMGEFEQLLKSTSLLATIGITELTRSGMNILSRELNPIPIYTFIACIYLLLAFILQVFTIYAEKKYYAYRQ